MYKLYDITIIYRQHTRENKNRDKGFLLVSFFLNILFIDFLNFVGIFREFCRESVGNYHIERKKNKIQFIKVKALL